MAGTIFVREVVRRASVLLQDIDPQFVRHPEREMIDWLNDAQRAIFTYLPAACSAILTVRLKAGTMQSIESIDMADLLPAPASAVMCSMLLDVLNNMGADGATPGRSIRPLADGREIIDTIAPNWHAESDTLGQQFIFDPRFPRNFLMYPGVPAGRYWVRMAVIAQPQPINNSGSPVFGAAGTDATAIAVHDAHVSDLVNYVCARALMKNAQFATATGMNAMSFGQLFTGSINAQAQMLMNYNPNLKRLPFAPDVIGAAS